MIAGGCAANPGTDTDKKISKPTVAEQQPTEQTLGGDDKKKPGNRWVAMNQKEQVMSAREDLAKMLDIPLEKVVLSGAIPVTWKSGALGCPKPGELYTQALVGGLSIMLRVDNKAYRYHAKTGGKPFHCPDHLAESPSHDNSDI